MQKMTFGNFVPSAPADPQRPSGTCEVGGRPARVTFDRTHPQLAWITVVFGPDGTPLPLFAKHVTDLAVEGADVPVTAGADDHGTGALLGSIDPALVDAVLADASPIGEASPPAAQEAPAANGGPGPEQPPAAPQAQAADPPERSGIADIARKFSSVRDSIAEERGKLPAIDAEIEEARARLEMLRDRRGRVLEGIDPLRDESRALALDLELALRKKFGQGEV